eukprot:TRINITY_DN1436_c0_g1_i1.p1 TRINITY_DN1436_c0_g1~~TRINITY_DN1436_c0_g1_i1.p1  ORF type:complete len:1150 (+),score=179.54 TRINITY_DN1436_c0_g1_i1:457-3906(+)
MQAIRVSIRVRPLNERETPESCISIDGENNAIVINDAAVGEKRFGFYECFGASQSNANVYSEVAKPLVEKFLDGYNATIFAYGQTGSGKTYSLLGSDSNPGIMFLATQQIFHYIEGNPHRDFMLRLSYLEVYNEEINDLLRKCDGKNLKIAADDKQKGAIIAGLVEELVFDCNQVYDIIKEGEENRHYGRTNMNEVSSRSHTVFRLILESRETKGATESESIDESGEGFTQVSYLNIVDLAGSERHRYSESRGVRLKEGGYINKSLFTLSLVISKLSRFKQDLEARSNRRNSTLSTGGNSTSSKLDFIPYRNSKLTRILKQSLGGNAFCSILCTVTMAKTHKAETLSTLKFGHDCQLIRNKVKSNIVTDDRTLLKHYRVKLRELKCEFDNQSQDHEALRLSADRHAARASELEAEVERLQSLMNRSTQNSSPLPKQNQNRRMSVQVLNDASVSKSSRDLFFMQPVSQDVLSANEEKVQQLQQTITSLKQLNNQHNEKINVINIDKNDLELKVESLQHQLQEMMIRCEDLEAVVMTCQEREKIVEEKSQKLETVTLDLEMREQKLNKSKQTLEEQLIELEEEKVIFENKAASIENREHMLTSQEESYRKEWISLNADREQWLSYMQESQSHLDLQEERFLKEHEMKLENLDLQKQDLYTLKEELVNQKEILESQFYERNAFMEEDQLQHQIQFRDNITKLNNLRKEFEIEKSDSLAYLGQFSENAFMALEECREREQHINSQMHQLQNQTVSVKKELERLTNASLEAEEATSRNIILAKMIETRSSKSHNARVIQQWFRNLLQERSRRVLKSLLSEARSLKAATEAKDEQLTSWNRQLTNFEKDLLQREDDLKKSLGNFQTLESAYRDNMQSLKRKQDEIVSEEIASSAMSQELLEQKRLLDETELHMQTEDQRSQQRQKELENLGCVLRRELAEARSLKSNAQHEFSLLKSESNAIEQKRHQILSMMRQLRTEQTQLAVTESKLKISERQLEQKEATFSTHKNIQQMVIEDERSYLTLNVNRLECPICKSSKDSGTHLENIIENSNVSRLNLVVKDKTAYQDSEPIHRNHICNVTHSSRSRSDDLARSSIPVTKVRLDSPSKTDTRFIVTSHSEHPISSSAEYMTPNFAGLIGGDTNRGQFGLPIHFSN